MATAKKKKRFVIPGLLLRLINIALILGLLLSYLAPYVPPDKFWMLAFFGLSYPFWAVSNVFFFFFWLFRKRIFALIPLISLLLGFSVFLRHFQFSGCESSGVVDGKMRVMTYNVKHFINNNRGIPNNNNRQNLFAFIGAEEYDLICFQEFQSAGKNYKDIIPRVTQHTGLRNSALQNYLDYFDGKRIDAIVTYSRYPIINTDKLKLGKKYFCLITDIKKGGDTIRVFNIHMQSIYFDDNDLQWMIDVAEAKNNNKTLKDDSKKIMWKLRNGFKKRAKQSRDIAERIAHSPFPVIVCGDMNDTPSSYTYRKIKSELYDSYTTCGSGFGNTYAGVLPPIRIDHIFSSKVLQCIDYKILKKHYSDHFPVTATFIVSPESIDEQP